MPFTRNPHLNEQAAVDDCLYHLGLFKNRKELQNQFGDVKFVVMGGTSHRMKSFAQLLQRKLFHFDSDLIDLAEKGHRYSMFKVGPVISLSHGIGSPSFLVVLHEIVKLLEYAKCENVVLIRLGTSGGIGVPPGSVVVSDGAFSDVLEDCYDFRVLGKVMKRPCVLDKALANQIASIALPGVNVVVGKTMGTSDFFEAQGRLDGAVCDYSEEDKMNFLRKLEKLGVVNIEMEAAMFSAFCNYMNIKAAIVCVTILNRLEGDQVLTPKETLLEWQGYPQELVAAFLVSQLNK